jgi:type II secretory ATPase GspE/PulE/Tfp pilus assembly ATPase PilB-like protein
MNNSMFPLSFLKEHQFLPHFTNEKEVHVLYTGRLSEEAKIFLETFYPDRLPVLECVEENMFWQSLSKYETQQTSNFSFQPQTVQEQIKSLLIRGIDLAASDIHFVPQEKELAIFYRCDGYLRFDQFVGYGKATPLINSIKVMSKMDVAESRRPQTGRFRHELAKHTLEVRVSSHPTLYGECLVLRLLTKAPYNHTLEDLGFFPEQTKILRMYSNRKSGLIVMTGPTGSGKTTTLYSLLREMNLTRQNVMTLEQPIEYFLPEVRQTEVQENGVMSFAEGVRSILRQDPDVILIGEIRDAETAAMAIRAAMTGHLVLTTLHTRSAYGVIERLRDLGIEQKHLSDLVRLVVAQRLIRRLCSQCKVQQNITKGLYALFEYYELEVPEFIYQSKGCSKCFGTGYQGRTVVAEILQEEHFQSQESMASYESLIYSGLKIMGCGETSFDEIKRELEIDDQVFLPGNTK